SHHTHRLILRSREAASRRMATGDSRASWFETALARLLTMRVESAECCKFNTTGKSLRIDGIVSSPVMKNILLYRIENQVHNPAIPCPLRGVSRSSRYRRARDAMDAVASGVFHRTKTLTADGEVVWSWRRDPGVKLLV